MAIQLDNKNLEVRQEDWYTSRIAARNVCLCTFFCVSI